MSCEELRPLLASFLTEALEPEQQEQVEAHLPECPACSEELVALLELSEGLAALEPASAVEPLRVLRGGGWIAAILSAAAILLGLLWIGERQARPAEALVTGGTVQRLAEGEVLVATGPRTIVLPCGSEVKVEAGARLRLLGRRELALDTGVGWFRVAKNGEPFLVRARGTRVRVLGTSFRVEVKEIKMSPKQGAAIGAAVIVAVVTGVVLFESERGSEELRAGQGASATTAGVITRLATEDEVAARLAPLEREREVLKAENDKLRAEQVALTKRVAEFEARLAARVEAAKAPLRKADPAPAPSKVAPAKAEGLRVRSFGVEQQDALKTVNWTRAGEGAAEIFPHLAAVWASIQEGKPIDPAVQKKLYMANQKLVEIILEVQGKLPTHAKGNGEFTHPLIIANLMAEHLANAGQPFDEAQLAGVSRSGEQYQAAWDLAQARYGEQTPLVRRLIDELILKRDCMAKVEALLTPAQREIVIFKEAQHVNQLDIYSPVMLVIMNAKPQGVSDERPLRARLDILASRTWGLSEADLAAASPALDAWARILNPQLVEAPRQLMGSFTLAEAVRSGSAQADAMEEILRVLPADSEAAKTILTTTKFMVPRKLVSKDDK
ncbi:MAG: FecR domain-containing protein [Planctomycetes bacterium]|nr:FecR domain-containing protein [Planctomycetota bacterium]